MINSPLNFFITNLILGQVNDYGERLKKLKHVLNLKEKTLITGNTNQDLKIKLEKVDFKQVKEDLFTRVNNGTITVAYIEDLAEELKNITFVHEGDDAFDPIEGLDIPSDETVYAGILDILASINNTGDSSWSKYHKSWTFMNIVFHSLFGDYSKVVVRADHENNPRFIIKYPDCEDILIVVTVQSRHDSITDVHHYGWKKTTWGVDILVKKDSESIVDEKGVLKFLSSFITNTDFIVLETENQTTKLVSREDRDEGDSKTGTNESYPVEYHDTLPSLYTHQFIPKIIIPEPTKSENFISKIIKSILGTK